MHGRGATPAALVTATRESPCSALWLYPNVFNYFIFSLQFFFITEMGKCPSVFFFHSTNAHGIQWGKAEPKARRQKLNPQLPWGGRSPSSATVTASSQGLVRQQPDPETKPRHSMGDRPPNQHPSPRPDTRPLTLTQHFIFTEYQKRKYTSTNASKQCLAERF